MSEVIGRCPHCGMNLTSGHACRSNSRAMEIAIDLTRTQLGEPDIVERLRAAGDDYTAAWGSGELYDEAADEIERLRQIGMDGVDREEVAAEEMRRMRHEFDTLRARIAEQDAEIARVKEACKYPDCVENEDERCSRWLSGDCKGPRSAAIK